MNILFQLHGVLGYSVGLIKTLTKSGINVFVFSPSTEFTLRKQYLIGKYIDYDCLRHQRIYGRLPSIIGGSIKYLSLKSVIKKCDIVHINSVDEYLFISFVRNFTKKPCVCTIHSFPNAQYCITSLKKMAEVRRGMWLKLLGKTNVSLVTVSKFMRQKLKEKFGIQTQVIYNGVDLKLFNPSVSGKEIRKSLGILDTEQIVLWVGRFDPIKDPLTFLRAIHLVLKECDIGIKFLVITWYKGQLHDRITSQLKREKLLNKYVFLMEGIPYSYMPKIYASCDVFVHTSLFESFGLALIEAMACGKPVIASKAGAIPEIVGASGMLFETGSPEDLARKIIFLLDDKKTREKLSEIAYRRVVENFTLEKMTSEYIKIYRDSLTASRCVCGLW